VGTFLRHSIGPITELSDNCHVKKCRNTTAVTTLPYIGCSDAVTSLNSEDNNSLQIARRWSTGIVIY